MKQKHTSKNEHEAGSSWRLQLPLLTILGDLVKNSENGLQTSGLPVTVVDVCGKSYTQTSLLKDSFENSVTGFIMNVDIDMALVFETT